MRESQGHLPRWATNPVLPSRPSQNLQSALGVVPGAPTLTLQVVMMSALGCGICWSYAWYSPATSAALQPLGCSEALDTSQVEASAAFLGDEANHPSHTVMKMMK